ncbi:DinB family protein [Filobacillus milosensis]|uniref:DinB family protein n=1 Tax=Filobacillus milosensis TaxID=94137 RepID=A0A4Y8IRV9_9BACI|nr:DinB family protein [Filobacillus milosensis]TFB21343.1 DinB family protein [Filobacillus milosensis]
MPNVQKFLSDWLNHREKLEKLLELVDGEQIYYKPWDEAMPLGVMALHISTTGLMFAKMVKTETYEAPDMPEFETAKEVREKVKDLTEETKQVLEEISNEELEEQNQAELPNLQGTKFEYLQAMYEHEIHHKGQLFLYARMLGLQGIPYFK